MDDLFRNLFGLRRNPPNDPKGYNEGEQNQDIFTNRGNFFGSPTGNLDDMFDYFQRDMFQQMESLHRQMEDMMKGFGAMDFTPGISPSPEEPNNPRIEDPSRNVFIWSSPSPFFRNGHNSSKKSPRDFMLKEEEKADSTSKVLVPVIPEERDDYSSQIFVPVVPKHGDGGFFGEQRAGRQEPEKFEDTDLDGKVSDKSILELIKRPADGNRLEQSPRHPGERSRPGSMFSSQSVSVSTIMGPDGKVEQKRVVRDSAGREESTVTRSIGDKSYTVTTITDEQGSQKHEKLQNIDQGDLNKFEELWSKPRHEQQALPADSMLTPHPPQLSPLNPNDRSLFFRLFGRGGN